MENAEENGQLLENVTVTDVANQQYMIQKMSVDNAQLLNTELLTHHGGLVVDLGGGDFIPVNYTSEDLLSHDLTEEDRNLAAALVAVQLSQQQKQQQLQHEGSLPTLVPTTGLDTKLTQEQLMLAEKSTSEAMNGAYLQIVSDDSIYQNYEGEEEEDIKPPTNEITITAKDSDGESKSETPSSKKSLPHKKRLSRKLGKKPPNLLVSRSKSFKCTMCETSFASNEELVEHEPSCQPAINPMDPPRLSCMLCSYECHDQFSFFEHLKSHYEPTSNRNIDLVSQVVEQETVDEEEEEVMPKALKIEVDTPKDTLLSSLLNLHCVPCNKTFRRQKVYETHMREVHGKVELNEFSEPEDLMDGINVMVGTDITGEEEEAEVEEMEDSKEWSKYRDDELQATEEDLRAIEEQDHVCTICKQPFPIRAMLLKHLTTCRATNEQSAENVVAPKKRGRKKQGEMQCPACDRLFVHRNSLIYHMRGHTGDRPHQCEHCGKSFFAASALKVHMRLHSGDKPYKCDFCGRHFRQWGDLKYHCISIHSDKKQYQCEFCGKDFARKYSLIVHRRIHTGEKNYKCEFCSKTFRASSYLQNHRRIHTGEKPHSCEVCGKPFRVRSDMKRHLKTHGRRRARHLQAAPAQLVVAKLEEPEKTELIIDSDEEEEEVVLSEEILEAESAVEELHYDQATLDSVREGNTLYTNGHQLFVIYPGNSPVRNEGSN